MSLPIERLAAWVSRMRSGEIDPARVGDECAMCGRLLVGESRALTEGGATLCDDPSCHVDELEARW